MVRLQLKIYFYSDEGGAEYPRLQLGVEAGEGETVFPCLHSGGSRGGHQQESPHYFILYLQITCVDPDPDFDPIRIQIHNTD